MLSLLKEHADLIFSAGSIAFIIGLIPMVRAADKPPLRSSITTGSWLGFFALTYVALGLTYSAITTAITASLWLTLTIQGLRRKQWKLS